MNATKVKIARTTRVETSVSRRAALVTLLFAATSTAQPSLEVTTPVNGASVADRMVMVSGSVQSALQPTLLINDVPTAVLTNGQVHSFSSRVSIAAGQNSILVLAREPGGAQAQVTLTVNRIGETPFSVAAVPESGLAALDVQFEIQRHTPDEVTAIEIDFDGDGIVDITRPAGLESFHWIYEKSGIYVAHFKLSSGANSYEYYVPITALKEEIASTGIHLLWSSFRTALAAQDVETASTFLSEEVAAAYTPILQQLSGNLPGIANSLSTLHLVSEGKVSAEYVVVRTIDGVRRAYFVEFARTENGEWKITGL